MHVTFNFTQKNTNLIEIKSASKFAINNSISVNSLAAFYILEPTYCDQISL